MADSEDNGLTDAARLQQPIARLLRPLVRLLIRYGVTFPALCELLRELYVNVAVHDCALPDKEQTDSRISLLTGIHRKEVRRLREAGAPVRTVPASVSRTSQIVALWLGDRRFADRKGAPAPLRRAGSPGRGPTFESLVEEVTRDVRPRAVLDEWLDRKIVSLDADGRIVLGEAAIAPDKGDERQLYYFGRNLHDHIAAAAANIVQEPAPFMERAVHYEGLSEAGARRLEALSRELAMEGLIAANREAQTLQRSDEEGRWRWTFGVYVYREDERPSSEPASGKKGARA
ncbi:DUF6502 family protein [Methylosinus sporium]|uniref:DUF6502 family protein n=1 Tax=Methylosinus sporium TaxID=428 RepID=UPI00383B53AA